MEEASQRENQAQRNQREREASPNPAQRASSQRGNAFAGQPVRRSAAKIDTGPWPDKV